ncbi:uncharacterized protein K02A2.6-like [Wyeomyia smithii]|uniref:uncharacterized protein K02A2.6-like n=1 Tax=Wyeomyia smithii TaxID=174621 RepID=UPI002467AEDB|nr:uncharacterized protein K02A2.6-like [Wyeomyia smithii]
MNLDELSNYAINREILAKQKGKHHPFGSEPNVNSIAYVRREAGGGGKNKVYSAGPLAKYKRTDSECDRCGSWKHGKESRDCFARNARCNGCGRLGHFARKCRASSRSGPMKPQYKKRPQEAKSVRDGDHLKEELIGYTRSDDFREDTSSGIITCEIASISVEFLIDSGAAINTVTEQVWSKFIQNKAALYKTKFNCDRHLTAYATQEPLKVLTIFEAWITVNDTKPKAYAEFFVIQGTRRSLLCKRTAEDLKVLKVGLGVHNVDVMTKIFPKFPNIQIKLSIDETVPPKKIAYLRIPAAMEERVDTKIQRMLDSDVIEPVVGPSEWISPMVVVPKGKDDIRLCINMKYPNQAIQREHYPLPMIDTLLNKLRGSRIFSKLDITSAFHHIELHPESRGITTFMTSRGLMRFKRLMFGINCAPEIFQRVMCEMLAGVEGVIVYINDIVVAGKTKREHDARLDEVLSILRDNNATLNKDKCIIGVEQLEILGYNVSVAGISPLDEKISAIRNFRQPKTKEEVRSFLGLINFIGQFIPHFSTRTEPLREFMRGDVEKFGKNQERAFDDLRNGLSGAVRRLGFYDPSDKTELYVDASASESDKPFDEESEHYLCAIEDSLAAITLDEIRTETANDESLSAVVEAIHSQIWPPILYHYQSFSKELGVINGIIVRDDRIVLPSKLRSRALDIAHRGHPGVVGMRRNLREKVWWPYMDRDVGDRIQECG